MDINLQQQTETLEACLKAQTTFTGTNFHNICDGSVTFVPLGLADYAAMFGIGLMILLLLAVTVFVIKEIIWGY